MYVKKGGNGGKREGAGRPRKPDGLRNGLKRAMICCYLSDWQMFCQKRDEQNLSSAELFRAIVSDASPQSPS